MITQRFLFPGLIALLLFSGCKNKNENNDQSKNADTIPVLGNQKDTTEIIRIKSEPDSATIDAAKTAVIVIDMENDFGTKGGMFDRAGINISEIQKVIEPTLKVLNVARQAGFKIIYLRMAYQPDLSDLGDEGSINRVQNLRFMHVGDTIIAPDGSKSRILIRGNWGTEIIPKLQPHANDIVMYKTRFSGFYNTGLDSILKKLNKKYLIVVGCTTSVCVESTIRDAMFRDYLPIVLEDCTAEPIGDDLKRSNKEASLLLIQEGQFGWVSDSKEFIKAVKERKNK